MKAIYPGSFDPVTLGHLDIIERAARIVPQLVVAVLNNNQKDPLFSVQERVEHLQAITAHLPGVRVASFSGLLVDFAQAQQAQTVVRGLRATTDFEYEFQMALTNRQLNQELETIFIPTNLLYLYISSRTVKEIMAFGGDFSHMVPPLILDKIIAKQQTNS